MPLNREMLNRIFSDEQILQVSAEKIAAYVAATNADPQLYRQKDEEGRLLAPPMFGVVPSREAMALAITDNALKADLARLLHAEQVMEFLSPIRVGDRLRSEAEIIYFADKRSGEIFDIEARSPREDGELVYRARVSLFIRAEERKAAADLLPDLGRAGEAAQRWPLKQQADWQQGFDVALDQAQRYAEASGDNNPIHINEDFAKAVGFDGCILHGLCTLAMAQNAVIQNSCDGDLTKLKSLRGKFSRPVKLGDSLTVRACAGQDDAQEILFEVLNQDGKAVIKEASARVEK